MEWYKQDKETLEKKRVHKVQKFQEVLTRADCRTNQATLWPILDRH